MARQVRYLSKKLIAPQSGAAEFSFSAKGVTFLYNMYLLKGMYIVETFTQLVTMPFGVVRCCILKLRK